MLILCYHAVSERWDAPLSATPDALERQLTWLVRRGYRGTTLTELRRTPGRPRAFAITFDDAYRSVAERAAPVLDELGLTATVFAPTSYVGTERPMVWPGIDQWAATEHRDELVPMSWSSLGELAERGWEVGSHTVTHPHLTDLDSETLEAELVLSREEIGKRIGRPCKTLAYPYGDHDADVVAAARDAGYLGAVTLPGPPHRPEPMRLPRVGVYHSDHDRRFRLKVSPAVRVARRSTALVGGRRG